MPRPSARILVALAAAASACGVEQTAPPAPAPPARALLVVAADELAAHARTLADRRAAQGYTVRTTTASELAGGAPTAEKLAFAARGELARLRDEKPGATLFVLLFGDALALPPTRCTNTLGACVTDNAFADLDDDGLPDAAVGRLPASDEAQAALLVEKVLAFDEKPAPGPWNRRVYTWASEGGFGQLVDSLLEFAFMQGVKKVSHAFDIAGAYDNTASPWYYMPFEAKVESFLNDGALAAVYVGHGSRDGTAGLDTTNVRRLSAANRLPVAVLLACDTGYYEKPGESLAIEALLQPRGPVATIASDDVSHPYGNALLAYEALRVLLDERPRTVGEMFQRVRRALVQNGEDEFRVFIDELSLSQLKAEEMALMRREHVNLYNLFGDPTTPTHLPAGAAAVSIAGGALAQQRLLVTGTTDAGSGTATVVLEAERDVLLDPLEPIGDGYPDAATVQRNWAKATNKVVATATVPVRDGRFSAELSWTRDLPERPFYVKAYVAGGSVEAVAHVPVE